MPTIFEMVLCYGICFGLMNKVDFPRKVKFFDRMLSCSYCTGFHSGWVSFVLLQAAHSFPVKMFPDFALMFFAWAFCSAAFCYAADMALQWVEAAANKASEK